MTSSASAPVLDLAHASKTYGAQPVLRDASWRIAPGQVIGLLGRNGAGKSTLLEAALGLCDLDGGQASVFGEPASRLSAATRARIGYVPQQSDLFEWMTAQQLLAYFKPLYPRWNDAKVEALLARWGFTALLRNKSIGTLSLGEKQRLSIVRALAHEPDLLVLDEPVASLDPVGRRDFLRELVDGVIERGTTVVFSTHILSDLERVAMDVAFLHHGAIALQAPLDELLDSARRITGSAALLGGMAFKRELRRETGADGALHIIARPDADETQRLAQAGAALRIDALNLEDLFIAVTN